MPIPVGLRLKSGFPLTFGCTRSYQHQESGRADRRLPSDRCSARGSVMNTSYAGLGNLPIRARFLSALAQWTAAIRCLSTAVWLKLQKGTATHPARHRANFCHSSKSCINPGARPASRVDFVVFGVSTSHGTRAVRCWPRCRRYDHASIRKFRPVAFRPRLQIS